MIRLIPDLHENCLRRANTAKYSSNVSWSKFTRVIGRNVSLRALLWVQTSLSIVYLQHKSGLVGDDPNLGILH